MWTDLPMFRGVPAPISMTVDATAATAALQRNTFHLSA